jgi:uncharacterized protein (DUF2461 family)
VVSFHCFSPDNSPYKTVIGGMVGDHYVQLSSGGLMAVAGWYEMEPGQLELYRAAVPAGGSGRKLQSIVDSLRKAGLDVHGSDELKTAPKGYPRDHPRVELLRHKGLLVTKSGASATWLGTSGAKKRIVDVFHSAEPLLGWLKSNVRRGAASSLG